MNSSYVGPELAGRGGRDLDLTKPCSFSKAVLYFGKLLSEKLFMYLKRSVCWLVGHVRGRFAHVLWKPFEFGMV